MEFKEIKNLNAKELLKKRKAMKELLFNSKMKNKIGQLANPLVIRAYRRDIARICTVLAEKQK